ncbi:YqaA family protein [Curvivirga sp.]|uniref:YqaA family protein n=1 Tax=Curvivirga sp. TaxID=2856848 RepID=UPI003B59FD23
MAFLAATILPLSSEALLIGLIQTEPEWIWGLVVMASLGNILGSIVNWVLGRWLIHFKDRKWFPVSEKSLQKAEDRFNKWGWPSLLLAWVPVIGDPLTLIAGAMHFSFRKFIILVTISKAGRYIILALIQHEIIKVF